MYSHKITKQMEKKIFKILLKTLFPNFLQRVTVKVIVTEPVAFVYIKEEMEAELQDIFFFYCAL